MSFSVIRRVILGFLVAAPLLLSPSVGFSGEVKLTGNFTGASDHITTGTVNVVQKDGEYVVVLGPDFSLDGAPDPKVGFGTAGNYDIKAQLGHLDSNTGEQSYTVPADLNIEGYDEIYIWCEKFSVPLGVAKIK